MILAEKSVSSSQYRPQPDQIAGERVIDEGIFSAVVIMVIVTTMVTPPALKWSLARSARRQDRPSRGRK